MIRCPLACKTYKIYYKKFLIQKNTQIISKLVVEMQPHKMLMIRNSLNVETKDQTNGIEGKYQNISNIGQKKKRIISRINEQDHRSTMDIYPVAFATKIKNGEAVCTKLYLQS